MDLPFSKYSGCGNDFIFVDNRQEIFPKNQALISNLCKRPLGIGADGLILLEKSEKADFKMRIFNSDGLEAEMCGNGLRCLKKFLKELGFKKSSISIETFERVLNIEDAGEFVKAHMGEPQGLKLDLELEIDHKIYPVHFLNTGVPHSVLFVENLNSINVSHLGRKIRQHPDFAPKGCNVNFVQILGKSLIAVATYERGVEEETLACGTGATASAILASVKFQLPTPIEVRVRSGESLIIHFDLEKEGFPKSVTQTGPARFHFKGSYPLSEIKEGICQLK